MMQPSRTVIPPSSKALSTLAIVSGDTALQSMKTPAACSARASLPIFSATANDCEGGTIDRMMSASEADIILSIVPPSQSLAVAEKIGKLARAEQAAGVFIDCNAVSPETMARVESAFDDGGITVLDGCIIGGPPEAGKRGPRF